MRIAEIAPPWYPIPPTGYGGIERVVFDLTESLVQAGQEVTLFAPAGSRTSAPLVPTVPRSVGLNLTETQKSRYFAEASRLAYRKALELEVDIIHDRTDYVPRRGYPIPVVRTIHGPATVAAVANYRAMSKRGDRLVAISARQHELPLAESERQLGAGGGLAFAGVVHNPIDVSASPFYGAEQKRGYAAFLGRCHWEKSPDGAIRVAQAAGVSLMMALRVTTEERPYFEAVVEPLILSIKNLARFVGEVRGAEKDDLIGCATSCSFLHPGKSRSAWCWRRRRLGELRYLARAGLGS